MQTVSELMTPSPLVIEVSQPLVEASERMDALAVRHLPVVDASGRLVGMLSDVDLYRFFRDKQPRVDPENMAVGEAMDPNPFTVSPEAPLATVARTMAKARIGAAVVMKGGSIAGVFTTVDALRALADFEIPATRKTVSPLRRILCPIDFSPGSREAVCLSLDLAQSSGASVTLFHAFDPEAVPFTPEMLERAGDQVLASLREWQLDYQRDGEAEIAIARGVGLAWRAIVDHAKANSFDLIVMGTHGRTGIARMLVGSVAESVTRHAPCPVMMVRQREVEQR
jgi:nucleotide-binding universal stress UspA family protein/CBS domain-containing protein